MKMSHGNTASPGIVETIGVIRFLPVFTERESMEISISRSMGRAPKPST